MVDVNQLRSFFVYTNTQIYFHRKQNDIIFAVFSFALLQLCYFINCSNKKKRAKKKKAIETEKKNSVHMKNEIDTDKHAEAEIQTLLKKN
jgi:hypothetical protein